MEIYQVSPDEVIFEDENDSDEEQPETHSRHRRIYTAISDPPISDLYNRFKDGDLNLQPDFQRHFVWDVKKSSGLTVVCGFGMVIPNQGETRAAYDIAEVYVVRRNASLLPLMRPVYRIPQTTANRIGTS